MRPNILDGDAVLVAPSAGRELRPGDIALVQNQDGLRVHRVASCDASSGAVVTRSDTGLASDPSVSRTFGKVVVLRRNSREESFTPLQTRFVHPLRVTFHRIRTAAFLRLRRAALLLSGIVALSLLCATFLAPAVHAQADLQLTQTASVTAVAVTTPYTYSEVVKNNGTNTVPDGTINVYMQTPANTVYEGFAGTNWACTNPGVGNAGPIVCTYTSGAALAVGASTTTLTITMQVTAGTAAGTRILNSATVTTSGTVDPVPSNNTGITIIYVEPTTTSDLSVSESVSPTPVFVSSNLTYTITVKNLGQLAAPVTTGVLTDTLPSGVTNVSSSASAGWSCSGTTTISCNITAAMTMGSTATISITVTAPSSATTLINTATVSLAGDPNPSNNFATAYTVVQPLVCATPGKDGAGGALTGIVNAYYPPSTMGTLAAGSKSVALGAAAPAGAQTAIASGDLLLIIQMQDATISGTNTGSYGDGLAGDPASGWTSLGSSGFFEFVTAASAVPVTGGTLTFIGTGTTGGLLNSYSEVPATAATPVGTATAATWAANVASFTFPTPLPATAVPNSVLTTSGFTPAGYNLTNATILSANTTTGVITVALGTNPGVSTVLGTGTAPGQGQQTYQVIRVPQYTSATLSSTLAPLAWNGSVGGVLAIDVSSQLTLGGTVAADALGSRGGGGITL